MLWRIYIQSVKLSADWRAISISWSHGARPFRFAHSSAQGCYTSPTLASHLHAPFRSNRGLRQGQPWRDPCLIFPIRTRPHCVTKNGRLERRPWCMSIVALRYDVRFCFRRWRTTMPIAPTPKMAREVGSGTGAVNSLNWTLSIFGHHPPVPVPSALLWAIQIACTFGILNVTVVHAPVESTNSVVSRIGVSVMSYSRRL